MVIYKNLGLIHSPNYPAGNYMFRVNNRNTRRKCEICSKLTIKTPYWRRSSVLLLTLNICFSFHKAKQIKSLGN